MSASKFPQIAGLSFADMLVNLVVAVCAIWNTLGNWPKCRHCDLFRTYRSTPDKRSRYRTHTGLVLAGLANNSENLALSALIRSFTLNWRVSSGSSLCCSSDEGLIEAASLISTISVPWRGRLWCDLD